MDITTLLITQGGNKSKVHSAYFRTNIDGTAKGKILKTKPDQTASLYVNGVIISELDMIPIPDDEFSLPIVTGDILECLSLDFFTVEKYENLTPISATGCKIVGFKK
ncbi:MAG: hypothetical protein NC346_09070 [Prevotella sp.]|nr:hypothetical protein [Prevotella sp.]MCM1443673.1 hypothetical protein [Muribaculum sp.]MCM1577144.1 hypothetical protein [Bacteroides sp.]